MPAVLDEEVDDVTTVLALPKATRRRKQTSLVLPLGVGEERIQVIVYIVGMRRQRVCQ